MKPPFVSTMISFRVSNQSIRSCQLLVSQISVSSLLSVPKCDQNFHSKLKVFVADQVQAAVTLFDFDYPSSYCEQTRCISRLDRLR
jgi:hypothetical protein